MYVGHGQVYYDEDDGEVLRTEDVCRGIERETTLMKDLDVYESWPRDRVANASGLGDGVTARSHQG